MGNLKRDYFGPSSATVIYDQNQNTPIHTIYPLQGESVLTLRLSDFSEADIHFLIRFIEGMGMLSGFPKVPVEKMDEFLDVLRELFTLIKGLQDGFGVQDVQNVIRILDRIYNLLH